MTLRQGYQLTDFLDDFISHHPDIPKFGRNHVFQGDFGVKLQSRQSSKWQYQNTVINSQYQKLSEQIIHKRA